MRVPGHGGDYSRKQLDDLIEMAKAAGAKGLAWVALAPDSPDKPRPTGAAAARSSFGKFVSDAEMDHIIVRLGGSRATCCCWWPTRSGWLRRCSTGCGENSRRVWD
ncbi:MAG: hypothetical protein HC884_04185 [Chloroflexaceae bacterium]|nr:hypothetical protein [Chloroflexaceae bacterium]